MKRFIAGLLVGIVLVLGIPVFAQSGVRIFVNGIECKFNTPPQIINGTVMVPLRGLVTALDVTMEWNESKQTAYIVTGREGNPFTATCNCNLNNAYIYMFSGFANNHATFTEEIWQNHMNILQSDFKKLTSSDISMATQEKIGTRQVLLQRALQSYKEVVKAYGTPQYKQAYSDWEFWIKMYVEASKA